MGAHLRLDHQADPGGHGLLSLGEPCGTAAPGWAPGRQDRRGRPCHSPGRREGPQRLDLAQRQEQFEALALPVTDALYATALRWNVTPAQAEDLVQETLLCAWRNFDRFTLGTNFRAWVFQILRFVIANSRRTARSREAAMDLLSEDLWPDTRPQATARYEPSEAGWEAHCTDSVGDGVRRALEHLNPDQRAVALRLSIGELSYQECDDELGLPLGTVMSRYSRARARLQQELRGHAVGQ